jgi:hypothetical protein
MARAALPSPLCARVMILVCGRVQGDAGGSGDFVELWGGKMGKKLKTKGKSDAQRVQGQLGGILKEVGFSADQVFQV